MDWKEIKETWSLAKNAYPQVGKLLVIPNNGKFDIFDGANGKSLGSLNDNKLTLAAYSGKTVLAKKRHDYGNGDRVRVVLEDSSEYMECGEVVGRKTHEGKDWYLVLTDGASNPRWFNAPALRPNMAGL